MRDPIGEERDIHRVEFIGAERRHAREAIGHGHAVEHDGMRGVAGHDEPVERVAAGAARGAVDEPGLGERDLVASVPRRRRGAAGPGVAVGAVHREVRAHAGFQRVGRFIRAHVARQDAGRFGGIGKISGVLELGDLVAGEAVDGLREVELARIEGKRIPRLR